jgi:hypothetical protein
MLDRILIGSQKNNPVLRAFHHIGAFSFNKCTAHVKGKRFFLGRRLVVLGKGEC